MPTPAPCRQRRQSDFQYPSPGPGSIGSASPSLALGLIALFSSYDHLTLAGRSIPIPQQWGFPLIAALVTTVLVDAQLASGSRLRATQDAARMADETARERHLAGEERQIARETEQLRQENARLNALNAKDRDLLSCVDQHCFPLESSSIPPKSNEPDHKPSLL